MISQGQNKAWYLGLGDFSADHGVCQLMVNSPKVRCMSEP